VQTQTSMGARAANSQWSNCSSDDGKDDDVPHETVTKPHTMDIKCISQYVCIHNPESLRSVILLLYVDVHRRRLASSQLQFQA
jgi:hypothetical protein